MVLVIVIAPHSRARACTLVRGFQEEKVTGGPRLDTSHHRAERRTRSKQVRVRAYQQLFICHGSTVHICAVFVRTPCAREIVRVKKKKRAEFIVSARML